MKPNIPQMSTPKSKDSSVMELLQEIQNIKRESLKSGNLKSPPLVLQEEKVCDLLYTNH